MSPDEEVQLQVMPDAADVDFDEILTPVLTFEYSHAGGPGWVLHRPDGAGGVDSFYLGGDVDDLDWAEDAAISRLRLLDDDPDAY